MTTLSTRRALLIANGLFIASALLACSSADECPSDSTSLGFAKKSSLGFSLAQALQSREGQEGAVTWSDPPDWLTYTSSDTELVAVVTYDDAKVTEESGQGDECETQLMSTLSIEIATRDGQVRATGEAEVVATKKDAYSLRAIFTGRELSGALHLGTNGRLVFSAEVTGSKSEGSLLAAVEEEGDMTSRVRQATIARWEGVVGDVSLPGLTDTADTGELIVEP
jgi:hypothetical protein